MYMNDCQLAELGFFVVDKDVDYWVDLLSENLLKALEEPGCSVTTDDKVPGRRLDDRVFELKSKILTFFGEEGPVEWPEGVSNIVEGLIPYVPLGFIFNNGEPIDGEEPSEECESSVDPERL